MRNETVPLTGRWLIVAAFAIGPGLSAGPYPTVAGLAESVAGLAESVAGLGGRALLVAGTVWLAITLLEPRDRARTPEVTR